MAEPRTIRFGVLCMGTTLPHWQAQSIRHLLELPGMELVVIGTPARERAPVAKRGFRGYLEYRILHLLARTAGALEDLSDPLSKVPVVELSKDGSMKDAEDVLAPFHPDIIFSFLPPLQEAGHPRTSSMPIWQFNFNFRGLGDDGMPVTDPHYATIKELPVQLISSDGQHLVEALFPLRSGTGRPSVDPWLLGAAWLPAKVISNLRKGIDTASGKSSNRSDQFIEEETSIFSLLKTFLGLQVHQLTSSKERTRNDGSWNIGILHQPITALLEEDPSMNVRWLPSPSDGNHRMEPFGYMAADGQMNVLYRKKALHSEQDSIARLRPKSDSVLKRSRSMLTTSASLSYPFVIERPEGAFALVTYPHQDRTELFKVASTNDGLDHVKTLLNRALSNPTLTEFEGRWWLFGTDPDAADTVLLAYHSDRFDGPFSPHALNPLKVDPCGTRPAGTFFRRGDELWRPALDNSDPDTMAVVLNKVSSLTPTTFQEEAGKRITGFRGTVYGNGIKTLSAMGSITLIDGVRKSGVENDTPRKSKGHRKRHRSKGT